MAVMLRDQIEQALAQAAGVPVVEVSFPELPAYGHVTTNVALQLSRQRGMSPVALAVEIVGALADHVPADVIARAEVAGPGFINIWLTPAAHHAVLGELRGAPLTDQLRATSDTTQRVIVEFSQPNIAKRMHAGHLRNTLLGDAIARCYEALGYDVVRWNYLGDWGTQFGKLMVAYQKWSTREAVEADPIPTLLALYVRFHEEAAQDPSLDDAARAAFRSLEQGDAEHRALWQWFREVSLREFERMYDLLDIRFTEWKGEAAYEGAVAGVVADLRDRGIAHESEGAIIVPLDAVELPPALVQKGDGGSLYLTRDLAVLHDRLTHYHANRIAYVVGNEQSLHFQQLFAVARLLGWDVSTAEHVKYGLVLGEEGTKLATREGKMIFAEDVLTESIRRAEAIVAEKRSEYDTHERASIARVVGLAALKYGMLKDNRYSDIVFNWDRMLDFSGESGPYLLYTYARIARLLRKADAEIPGLGAVLTAADGATLVSDAELLLIRQMTEIVTVVRAAAAEYAINKLTLYLYHLANTINTVYEAEHILTDSNVQRRADRLQLLRDAHEVLAFGLGLLGIRTSEAV